MLMEAAKSLARITSGSFRHRSSACFALSSPSRTLTDTPFLNDNRAFFET